MTVTTTTIGDMNMHNGAMIKPVSQNPEVLERSSGRRQFSAKYKAKILSEYDGLSRRERGAMLRREGLYSSLVASIRDTIQQESRSQTKNSPPFPWLDMTFTGSGTIQSQQQLNHRNNHVIY